MLSRNFLAASLCALASLSATASHAQEAKPNWLIGTWVLCDDPDHSPKDSLQFNSDGTGLVIRAKGNLQFVHKHSGRSVSILANAHGYAIPIELSASPGFDRLLLHSDKTGSTSNYVKSNSTQARKCSIK